MPQPLLGGLSVERRTEGWERSLRDGATEVLVAADPAGTIVGCVATGNCRDDDAEQGLGELFAIYLYPDCWDQGGGRALFEAGTTALTEQFDEATLWLLDTNARARAFHERNGWQPDGATKRATIADTEVEEVRNRRHLAGQRSEG